MGIWDVQLGLQVLALHVRNGAIWNVDQSEEIDRYLEVATDFVSAGTLDKAVFNTLTDAIKRAGH